jgi:CBS domain-containing protein
MKVSDVMTHRVISVSSNADIRHAVESMLKHRISGLPVIDDGKLVGIVSEADFLRRAETGTERKLSPWYDALFGPDESAAAFVRAHGLKVHDVMTRDPITVTEDAPLHEVVNLMERHRIKRLPVVRAGKVIGMVTRANLLRALASIHRASPKSVASDADIRKRILSAMAKETWSAGALVEVTVHDGVVDLWGAVIDAAQHDALKVLVQATPGVKRVEDHVAWSGPIPPI